MNPMLLKSLLMLGGLATGTAMAEEAAPVVEAAAEAAPELNSGDTAWMLTSTVLVLMMTIPGVALFYGGMVRKKNVLSVLMQSFAITGLVGVLWMLFGYSLAFDTTGMEAGVMNLNTFIGTLNKAFLSGVNIDSLVGTFPESVFVVFQMTFAIITAALITGAVAERMKFSSLLVFVTAWLFLVYVPIAHMVWSGDGALFWDMGALDFAGGLVVHINAGVTGLVAAMVLGKRIGYGKEAMPPHNLVLTLIGGALLWVGWFGFNAGSAIAADGRAGMAMLATMVATSAAALSWMFAEWMAKGKPSLLGIVSGAIGGLVAITPAAGFVGPVGALIIGLVAGVAAYWGATSLKRMLGYDDSLDAFGVHGVAGIVGALLVGFLAVESIGGVAGGMGQFMTQLLSVVIAVVYIAVVSFIILKVIDMVMGLRVSEEEEREGLDTTLHGERVE
jgi:Amt family ammonium transporter